MLTRDSVVLTLTIIAAVLGIVVAQYDLLPAGCQPYKGIVTIALACAGVVAGILRTSPLAGQNTPSSSSYPAFGGLVKLSEKDKV